MKHLVLVLALCLVPSGASSHNNEDPIKDLKKIQLRLIKKQQFFDELGHTNDQVENLQEQVDYLQKNILILRNMIAKELPIVSEGMSKYKLDYIEQIDQNLKIFKKALQQYEDTIDP